MKNSYILILVLLASHTYAKQTPDSILQYFHELVPVEITIAGHEAYERLEQIPKRINHKEPKEEIAQAFYRHCDYIHVDCLAYLTRSPEDALAVLPDNPDYWDAYIMALETTPFGLVKAETPYQFGVNVNPMFTALTQSLIRNLALGKGIETHQLIHQIRRVRSLSQESTVLIEKMLAIAMNGMVLSNTNLALAHAHATNDQTAIQVIYEELKSWSQDNFSMRRTLEGETKIRQLYIANGELGFETSEWVLIILKKRHPWMK